MESGITGKKARPFLFGVEVHSFMHASVHPTSI